MHIPVELQRSDRLRASARSAEWPVGNRCLHGHLLSRLAQSQLRRFRANSRFGDDAGHDRERHLRLCHQPSVSLGVLLRFDRRFREERTVYVLFFISAVTLLIRFLLYVFDFLQTRSQF